MSATSIIMCEHQIEVHDVVLKRGHEKDYGLWEYYNMNVCEAFVLMKGFIEH